MTNENARTTGYDEDYHDRQFVSPYESTKAFCDCLCEIGAIRADQISNIGDFGCGKGANTYSIPEVKSYLYNQGFTDFRFMRFNIPIDIPWTDSGMRTYTEKTEVGRRLQIFGPILLGWYFIYASQV